MNSQAVKQSSIDNKYFTKLGKFHPPGLAPCTDKSGAYHINLDGNPIYKQRYEKSFGYYDDLAAVVDQDGWYHINIKGDSIYSERYQWCGNFQQHACVVKSKQHHYFHIDHNGKRLYQQNYQYAGDFRDNIATVQNAYGNYSHINKQGQLIHNQWFLDLDVYHKGYARAKDIKGWFHIDTHGKPIYELRYAMIEPFYNGQARCETHYGELLRIDESGNIVETLKSPHTTEFQALSSDIVGYWRTQTIKAAVDLSIFDHLPSTLAQLSGKINVNMQNTQRLLRALLELNLVSQQNDQFKSTSKGQLLTTEHPLSLTYAVKHWGTAHYNAWSNLSQALKLDKEMYTQTYGSPLFDWLEQDPKELQLYHNAMTPYAVHDYDELSKLINTDNASTIIDAAGGKGVLLEYILNNHNNLTGTLLERPSVIRNLFTPSELTNRMDIVSFDLFKPWPVSADIITLSRVLHDWNDADCHVILSHATKALHHNGRINIIEFLLNETCNGGMLDMNMLVITGGKERNLESLISLAASNNLTFLGHKQHGNYHIIEFGLN